MTDYTEVSRLLEEARRAFTKSLDYADVHRSKLKEARSKCGHPAWKKESRTREDEYGKTVGYDVEAVCLICGHVESKTD